jgi:hypothetical protein
VRRCCASATVGTAITLPGHGAGRPGDERCAGDEPVREIGVKAWGDPEQEGRRRDPDPWVGRPAGQTTPLAGHGYERRDSTVLDVDAALAGRSDLEYSVLVHQDSGAWYGEDARWPGSYLVPLGGHRLVRSTPDASVGLIEVARVVREARDAVVTRTAERRRRLWSAEARRLVGGLSRPRVGRPAFDAGRVVDGHQPEAASWSVSDGRARLDVAGRWEWDDYEPDRQWETDPDLLVDAGDRARRELSAFAARVAADIAARRRRAERVARRIGRRCLATFEGALEDVDQAP